MSARVGRKLIFHMQLHSRFVSLLLIHQKKKHASVQAHAESNTGGSFVEGCWPPHVDAAEVCDKRDRQRPQDGHPGPQEGASDAVSSDTTHP